MVACVYPAVLIPDDLISYTKFVQLHCAKYTLYFPDSELVEIEWRSIFDGPSSALPPLNASTFRLSKNDVSLERSSNLPLLIGQDSSRDQALIDHNRSLFSWMHFETSALLSTAGLRGQSNGQLSLFRSIKNKFFWLEGPSHAGLKWKTLATEQIPTRYWPGWTIEAAAVREESRPSESLAMQQKRRRRSKRRSQARSTHGWKNSALKVRATARLICIWKWDIFLSERGVFAACLHFV